MRLSLILTAFALGLPAHADKELPVIHKEDFSKDASAWQTTDDSKWKLTTVEGNQVFELLGVSKYRPPLPQSPQHCAPEGQDRGFLRPHRPDPDHPDLPGAP